MGRPAAPGANEERAGCPDADGCHEGLDVVAAPGPTPAITMPGNAVIAVAVEVAPDTGERNAVVPADTGQHLFEQRRWQTSAASRLPPPHQARLENEPVVHGHGVLGPRQPGGELGEEQVGPGQPTRHDIDPAVVVELVTCEPSEPTRQLGFPRAEQRTLQHRDKIGHMFDPRERTDVRQVEIIADPDDARVALFRSLNDAALRRDLESEHGVFVVEGATALRRLFESGYEVVRVLVLDRKVAAIDQMAPPTVEIVAVNRELMASVVGFDLHRGVVAIARRRPPLDVGALAGQARLLLVLEALNDVENLGAIARTARAFGVDGLVLDPRCADPLYRRCVRVSMGEMLRLPFARSTDWPADLDRLTDIGYTVVALTPDANATPIEDFTPATDRVALVLGAEWSGLSPAALGASTERVRITISPDVDSLNVGHAAAVACHRLGRFTLPAP